MSSNQVQPSILKTFKELVTSPIETYYHWGFIILLALAFVFIPQVPPPNDWQRNTAGLFRGLSIFHDPNAVYPPWALILLWPYYFLTAAGSRIASVLVIGWLSTRQKWTLLHFIAIIFSPFFLWTMTISNMDVLTLLLPILIWEWSEDKTWQWLGMSISLLLFFIKPQGSFLIVLYFIWKERHNLKALIVPVLAVLFTIVPISLVGNPPLVIQWLNNAVINPSVENLNFWSINNVSLTDHLGIIPGLFICTISFAAVYGLMRHKRKPWAQNHTYASILLLSLLLGPYASNQSMIVPLSFLPSWPAVVIQYALTFIPSYFRIYQEYSAWWALIIGVAAVWFYRSPRWIKTK